MYENDSVREAVAKHEAQLDMLIKKIDEMSQKLDRLYEYIMTVDIISNEVNNLKKEIEMLRSEQERTYNLYRWVIALIATGFASITAVIIDLIH